MTNKNDIGARLRELRDDLGISQQDLADRLGVKRNTIGSWERGIHYPSGEFMARALEWGFDLYYLVTGKRDIQAGGGLTAQETALVDNYRHATEKGRAAARAVLDAFEKPTSPGARRKAAGDKSD